MNYEKGSYILGLRGNLQHSVKRVYLGLASTYISQFHAVKRIRKQREGFQIQRPRQNLQSIVLKPKVTNYRDTRKKDRDRPYM
ncbi:hypothetical protein QL285_048396 [Trifolium repens]|nr:hypothetical protein QL285_048396 [Trifolium repens]